jgi:hypothetical protein
MNTTALTEQRVIIKLLELGTFHASGNHNQPETCDVGSEIYQDKRKKLTTSFQQFSAERY